MKFAAKILTVAVALAFLAAVTGAFLGVRELAFAAKLQLLPAILACAWIPLAVAIALTLLFALPEAKLDNLLPLRLDLSLLRGTLPTLDVAALILTLLFFLSDGLTGAGGGADITRRVVLLGALMAALVAAVTGAFGHELAAAPSQPYFSLVRNLVLFRSLERVEALPAALWIFSDFLLVSALLLCARKALSPLCGARRGLPAVLGALTLLAACLLAPDAASYRLLSLRVVPLANACVCALLIPGVYVAGRMRRNI